MKQFFLYTVLMCVLGMSAQGAVVTGTITNAATSAPVANQRVFLYDGITSFRDSALTNASGVYTITIPSFVPTFDSLAVYTRSCGNVVTKYPFYTGSSLTVNFAICVSSPTTYTIHGSVSLSGTSNNGLATVYLIRKAYDSTLMDTVLTAIDSFATTSTGAYTSNTYYTNPLASLPWGGSLLLKAALQPGHPSYSAYAPTYYTQSQVWSGATPLSASNFVSTNTTNINMITGTNPGGAAFVGGSVILGANKANKVGDPLPGRIIILTNSTGVPLTYTYSDTNGNYGFGNLALGTYKLFGDAWGKLNPALTFTVTAARPRLDNIIFEENSTKFEAHFSATLAVSSSALESVSVYPNPVTDKLSFSGLDKISGEKTVVVHDITGAVISKHVFAGGEQLVIGMNTLSSGVYMLQLQTSAGTASFRVVK